MNTLFRWPEIGRARAARPVNTPRSGTCWILLPAPTCLIDGHRAFAGLPPSHRRAVVVVVALHDVGKISNTFRALFSVMGILARTAIGSCRTCF